jgi:hypothetical protein
LPRPTPTINVLPLAWVSSGGSAIVVGLCLL